jgi:NADPH-dependent F420 reductase
MLGFLGGTGPAGRGLALRLALAGERVSIGSRDRARAEEAARSISALAPGTSISGGLNADAAREATVVFVTVPYPAQRQLLEDVSGLVAGKVVVDVVAPVEVSNGVARAVPVAEGSAALEAQAILSGSAVAAAFQTISARDLLDPDASMDSDVVVCADDNDARDIVMKLAERVPGIRAVNGGSLQNAAYVENLTALLLNINRLYRTRSSIKITGI